MRSEPEELGIEYENSKQEGEKKEGGQRGALEQQGLEHPLATLREACLWGVSLYSGASAMTRLHSSAPH